MPAMAQPTPFSRSTAFADEESSNVGGRSTVRTARVDAEFDAVALTLSETLANLALIQRDDGKLRDSVVELHALSSAVMALLSSYNATPRGPWLTATDYAYKDLVSQSGNTYICVVAHTSGTFATDLAANRWLLFSLGTAIGAGAVTFTPTGTIAATNVQDAINESDTEIRAAVAVAQSTANAALPSASLSNTTSDGLGASLVGYNPVRAYAAGLGEFLNRLYARTAGEFAAGVTPTNYHFVPGDVRRYGADPTGVSNSLTAWQAAFASSKEVYAPSGTYEFGSVSGGTTMIDLSTRGNDITLRTGRGVKLRCTTTSDIPYFFRLDNNSRCTFGDIEFEDLGGDNTVTWKGAFGFYLTNNTPTNWGNLKFGTITCTKLVAPITAQATGSATNRIRDIVIDQINLTDCYYGLLLQNDGDSVKVDQITANSCVRPFFVYGVSGVEAKVFGRNNLGTSGAVHISRQTGGLNTSNIRVSYVGRNAALNATHVLLSHTDISGGEINGVDLTIDLEGSVSYNSVRFVTYNAGAEYAPATNNIINNVRIWARCGANAASVSTPSAFNTKGRLWFYADGGLGLTQSTIDQFRIGNAANGNTPTWATSGTQPAIVNGSLTSNYAIADGVCTENIRMQAGSSTTFGTGAWTFSTAFTATQTATGSVYLRDATGSHWVGVARLVTGTNVVALYSTNGNGVDATNPFTWASTDYLEITISYRFAQ